MLGKTLAAPAHIEPGEHFATGHAQARIELHAWGSILRDDGGAELAYACSAPVEAGERVLLYRRDDDCCGWHINCFVEGDE